jgi:hypothetical protein
MSDADLLLHRTIATISQSDPLIKLLEQVRLGRMNRDDPGLRVVINAWVATYRKAIASPGLTKEALRRLDPSPRLDVLRHEGMLPADHPEVHALMTDFERALGQAPV